MCLRHCKWVFECLLVFSSVSTHETICWNPREMSYVSRTAHVQIRIEYNTLFLARCTYKKRERRKKNRVKFNSALPSPPTMPETIYFVYSKGNFIHNEPFRLSSSKYESINLMRMLCYFVSRWTNDLIIWCVVRFIVQTVAKSNSLLTDWLTEW